jgi:predicted acylesterase/phospholipase RssA
MVIAGGSVYGFSFFGALKTLQEGGIWQLSNIKTIYAVSVGSIIATMISLGYDWDILERYLIHRPFGELIKFDISTILGSLQNCGFFTIKLIDELLYNLFTGKDISPTITMKEYYELTGIELHFFTVTVCGFALMDISHKTHPDWTMVEAMHASCAIPPFLSPLLKDGEMYCDGGFLTNYPMDKCIDAGKLADANFDVRQILGINLSGAEKPTKADFLRIEKYNIFNYLNDLLGNILLKLQANENETQPPKEPPFPVEINVDRKYVNFMDFTLYATLENRVDLIQYGIQTAEEFVKIKNGAQTGAQNDDPNGEPIKLAGCGSGI